MHTPYILNTNKKTNPQDQINTKTKLNPYKLDINQKLSQAHTPLWMAIETKSKHLSSATHTKTTPKNQHTRWKTQTTTPRLLITTNNTSAPQLSRNFEPIQLPPLINPQSVGEDTKTRQKNLRQEIDSRSRIKSDRPTRLKKQITRHPATPRPWRRHLNHPKKLESRR